MRSYSAEDSARGDGEPVAASSISMVPVASEIYDAGTVSYGSSVYGSRQGTSFAPSAPPIPHDASF